MPAKFGFRKNRVTSAKTPLKGNVNVAEKENIAMSEHEHHLRDIIAHSVNAFRKQGKTNQEIRTILTKNRQRHKIIELVTKDPNQHVQKRLLKKYTLKK
jgi:hypothetical protein